MPAEPAFDGSRFVRAIDFAREAKGVSWREIARDIDVSASTITRIKQGAKPDVDTFFNLCTWADLNPAEFQSDTGNNDDRVGDDEDGDSMTKIAAALRADPNLTSDDAELLEAVLLSAYQRIVRSDG